MIWYDRYNTIFRGRNQHSNSRWSCRMDWTWQNTVHCNGKSQAVTSSGWAAAGRICHSAFQHFWSGPKGVDVRQQIGEARSLKACHLSQHHDISWHIMTYHDGLGLFLGWWPQSTLPRESQPVYRIWIRIPWFLSGNQSDIPLESQSPATFQLPNVSHAQVDRSTMSGTCQEAQRDLPVLASPIR